ncbi:hypothetical protein BJ508DRAFT_412930 [Ascobolus immersus RN42]|uniref:Uncharacterized protein n=1 Tax=Ascobolus immersus RN42 TaxID=1160509 RepID=A0A3N4IEN7_ASCIM|nr:hypothetical protein BJ508DRAFT_412930 [Ascobolus immersus RN42]
MVLSNGASDAVARLLLPTAGASDASASDTCASDNSVSKCCFQWCFRLWCFRCSCFLIVFPTMLPTLVLIRSTSDCDTGARNVRSASDHASEAGVCKKCFRLLMLLIDTLQAGASDNDASGWCFSASDDDASG